MKYTLAILLIVAACQVKAQPQLPTNDTNLVDYKLLTNFQDKKPIFRLTGEQATNKSRLLRFSVLTGYREGIKRVNYANAYKIDYDESIPGVTRLFGYNESIVELLKVEYMMTLSHVVLEVKDPSKYRYLPQYGPMETWLKKNGYCYELAQPSAFMGGDEIFQQNLAADLGLKVSVEKRMVKCLILVRTSNIDKIKSTSGPSHSGQNAGIVDGSIKNETLSTFREVMDFEGFQPPLVDETGYQGNVDMELNLNTYANLQDDRKALQRYDLDLKEGIREQEVLVIKEIK